METSEFDSASQATGAAPEGAIGSCADRLGGELVREMADGWRRGESPRAEDFFRRYPRVGEDPVQAVRLIYEEICLRQEAGEPGASIEVARRFPHYRAQLEVLLDCHRLLQAKQRIPRFPAIDEAIGEFVVTAELGRGALGRVFLAIEPGLADRPVVIKCVPRSAREHLSLARLQHTHIVPLYSATEDVGRDLRVLCMPYFGGITLDRVLNLVNEVPIDARSGSHFLEAIQANPPKAPLAMAPKGPAWDFLRRASYSQAVCALGACLAEGLQYAHDRGLVHLDLKPSNVLLTADGQPMLLDFHLARGPIHANEPWPEWLGGTPQYMSPEQRLAVAAVHGGQPIGAAVDGRSDVFSLGLVVYEALGGRPPECAGDSLPPLYQCVTGTSRGLSDIVAKCLATEPERRYADAASLARELRRHVADLPLQGVRNRDLSERWRKWRRRQPHAPTIGALTLVLLGAVLAGGLYALKQHREHNRLAESALQEGVRWNRQGKYAEAAQSLEHGLQLKSGLPVDSGVTRRLQHEAHAARLGQARNDLHALVDQLRFTGGMDSFSLQRARQLQHRCADLWSARESFLSRGHAEDGAAAENLRQDLLDLVILGAALEVKVAAPSQSADTKRNAIRMLDEAEKCLGTNSALYRERRQYLRDLGHTKNVPDRPEVVAPETPWQHYALGRFHLRSGDLSAARAELDSAVALKPDEFWFNFYQGLCAYRQGSHQDSLAAFRASVSLMPHAAECFFNRALVYSALGNDELALADYNRALTLDATFAPAALNRGILRYEARRYSEAESDLRSALNNGADPGSAHYHLALVYLARRDRGSALASLRRALQADPGHLQARHLLDEARRTGS